MEIRWLQNCVDLKYAKFDIIMKIEVKNPVGIVNLSRNRRSWLVELFDRI